MLEPTAFWRLPVNVTAAPSGRASTTPPTSTTPAASASSRNIKGKKSHAIVQQGLQILRNLTHRGAVGADPLAGDGAGILIQIPDAFLREELATQGVRLPPLGQYGVGMVFLPKEPASRLACEYEIERAIKDEGQVLLGWRDVPVDDIGPRQLGQENRAGDPAGLHRPRQRRHGHRRARAQALRHPQGCRSRDSGAQLAHGKEFYVPSMSARTIVYKGMLLAEPGRRLTTSTCRTLASTSALALVHQRFSTNTFPTWDLAHPVPADRPQRRDQHAARQRELDARAPRRDLEPDSAAATSTRCGR